MQSWLSYFKLTETNWIVDLAIWLILFMPTIVFVGVAHPFSFGRYVTFMFVILLLILGVCFVKKIQFQISWWHQPIFWLTLIWLIVAIISASIGVNPFRSWWGTVSRSMGMFFYVGLWIFSWLMLLVVNSKERWLKVLSIMSWVGGISSFYALLQMLRIPGLYIVASGERASALMGNPIFFGQLLVFTIFLTAYFALTSFGKTRWFYLASLFIQLFAILSTASRGPLLALFVGSIIWLIGIKYVYRQKTSFNWKWIFAGSGLSLVTLMLIYKLVPNASLIRIFDFYNSSLQARLVTWKTAWLAIQDKPFLGYGNENAWFAFTKFYQPGLADISFSETIVDRAHNFILDQMLANGWLGLILITILFGYVILSLWRNFKNKLLNHKLAEATLIWSFLVIVVAYLIFSVTAFDTVTNAIYGSILLAAIIRFVSPEAEGFMHLNPMVLWRIVLVALLVIVFIFDFKYLVPAFKIGAQTKIANSAIKISDYQVAAKAFVKAQETLPNPYQWSFLANYPSFARQYAILLLDENPGWANSMAVDGLRVADNIKRQEPDRVAVFMEYPLLYTVMSFFDPRYEAIAEKSFDDLVAEFPNHEYIYLNWARSLMGVNKYIEAKQILSLAADKFPVLPKELEFWRAWANISLKTKNKQAVIMDLQSAANKKISFSVGEETVLRNITAYLVDLKSWEIARYYQEKIVLLLPQNIDEHINLSAIYKEIGDYKKAAEQARIVVQLDPSKTELTQQFLQSIGQTL